MYVLDDEEYNIKAVFECKTWTLLVIRGDHLQPKQTPDRVWKTLKVVHTLDASSSTSYFVFPKTLSFLMAI